jgi:hypothetical protein
MRKMIALFTSMAFLLGTTGVPMAQTTTPAPTQEKKTEEKATEKKPATKAMSMEEKKAACLEKAGSNEAKKADCEKKFVTKPKAGKAMTEKREEKK